MAREKQGSSSSPPAWVAELAWIALVTLGVCGASIGCFVTLNFVYAGF